ncbi:nSTAND1 domain-containing NTPase [Perlabentimonas gracilis]|uniref:nSTAND1 domain-containing NTPase n=1 Tax=Perlabentimonas gracilis TaxID=2715279 RepID=UPI001409C691|nr:High-affnity carbon uptake protein Hat/HatR [Perlabentimonas gracilis]NHB67917.1 High-affnity carbon uptake protein Hat/HatR [Perlabentimonas gracilis]
MDTLSRQNSIVNVLENPFPGLRPFEPKEAHLFFGREGQNEEIIENLSANRFAAILGASGSGKSSLIYCGLLPTLYGGFLHNGRSKWRVTVTRPGTSPIENLAHSIAEAFSSEGKEDDVESDAMINQAVLKRSANGISNVLMQSRLAADENVLILVDQFEEIFRYQYSSNQPNALDNVEHFINLLVSVVKQQELPVYVVITMRSDFIGDCSPFQRFTRLINDSHYLIPRMTREDFRKAITGPVAVGGGQISDQLVQLLLNEMGNNPDHLPILQHTLMRTWEYWVNHTDTSNPIGIVEYEAIGRLERSLSNHANEAFDELSVEQKRVCEVIFKSLTEKGADNRGIRRPTSVQDLAAIAETSFHDIISVVEIFRQQGRTFLTPPPHVPLTEDSMVDVSHESLMRVWDKLKIWVEDESAAVKMYLRLAESAELYSEGKTGLWGPPDLQMAINWRQKQEPNLAWAVRYHPAFERTMVYLRTSEEEYIAEEENKIRLQKRALRRSRIVAVILGSAGMISIGLGILALIQRQDALKAQTEALEQKDIAELRRVEAEEQKTLAEQNAELARQQREQAELSQIEAERQRLIALKNLNEADRQRLIATQKEQEATANQKLAEANEIRALEQQRLAEEASFEAERRRMLSISQSMAVKSQQMRADTTLKGLLAFQAYTFNQDFNGVSYNPDIHKAIYLSSKFYKGDNYNVLDAHRSLVRTLHFSENTLYSSGSDGRLFAWENGSREPNQLRENLSVVKKVIVDEDEIVGINNNGIFRVDKHSNAYSERVYFPNDIKDFYKLNNGKLLLVFAQSIATVNDYQDNPSEVYRTTNRINASKFNPSTGTLFLAMADGQVLSVSESDNWQMPKQIAMIPDSNWGEVGYSEQRKILAAGFGNFQGAIYLWSIETGELLDVLRGHSAKITGLAFSSDGRYMASSSYDGSVRLWHLDDLNTLPIVFDDHETWVTSVTFTPDGKFIVSGDKNGSIKLLPVDISTIISDYCQFITRTLTPEEWNSYVGEDIEYNPKECKVN